MQSNSTIFSPAIDTSASSATYTYYVQAFNGICPGPIVPVTYMVHNVGANFNADPDNGEIDLELVFDNLSFGVDSVANFNWDFGDGSTSTDFEPLHTFDEKGEYIVVLTIDEPCLQSYEFTIIAKATSELKIPNVFSPNGDGSNELFNMGGVNLTSIDAQIYNRWGQLIYLWNTVEGGWDGHTLTGALAPPGTYYYVIDATGLEDKPEEYRETGTVTLVR